MNYREIVYKLVGPIGPIGETHTDAGRLGNLYEMESLVDCLLSDIAEVAKGADSDMHSVSVAGKEAAMFLKHISEGVSEDIHGNRKPSDH